MAQRGKGARGANLAAGDYILLGSKASSGGGPKRSDLSGAGGSASASSSTAGPSSAAMMPMPSSQKSKSSSSAAAASGWETLAVPSLDVSDVVRGLTELEDGGGDRAAALLCSAVRLLRSQRAKPDQVLYLSLLLLAKTEPHFFLAHEYVVDAFCSLLRRDPKESYKSRGNALVSVLAANILSAAFRDERNWPECFVRVYVDDAMGERLWVDHPDCRGFVDNILTAFGTKLPASAASSHSMFGKPGDGGASGGAGRESPGPSSGSATPTRVAPDDDDSSSSVLAASTSAAATANPDADVPVQPRYQGLRNVVEHLVMEVVREQLARSSRQGGAGGGATENITRNFLRFLTSACGLPEVRLTVIAKVEMWVMNPKVSRAAHELLLAVAMNCSTHTPMDVEVLGHFAKLRFKSKPNINLYLQCVREIAAASPENLPAMVKHTIFNELSNARNTTNMAVLQSLFSCDGERAAASLASVFVELLLQKDCYLRALRALLREVVKALRGEINLNAFCLQLMKERPKEQVFQDFEFKDRMFSSITDLVSLAIFLGVSPPVREAINAIARGDKGKDTSAFRNYLKQVSKIQRDALWWLHETVPKLYKTSSFQQLYPHCLRKVLFMVNHDEYCHTDGWPAENERHLYFKATSEIPLLQDTVVRLFLIGLSKSLPLNGPDTVDLVEYLARRAASLQALAADDPDFAVLHTDKGHELIEFLINLGAYNYPESIALPADYRPPVMSIKPTYWKMFMILTMYSAHNPSVVGCQAWEEYPTLRCFLEMCITNQFEFPPPTMAEPGSEDAELLRKHDAAILERERKDILQFESHLAAATNSQHSITESNSLLLDTLITMDPKGPPRSPSTQVLEELKKINQHCKIGHLLCRSRNPDFLLNILNRQGGGGGSQSMPWLADLVESSEGSFGALPVQCLCEYLLSNQEQIEEAAAAAARDEGGDANEEALKRRKGRQLLAHLQGLLFSPSTAPNASGTACETLEYFLRRLSSQQTRQRLLALRGLKLVLTPLRRGSRGEEEMEVDGDRGRGESWLLTHLPTLPCFREVFPHISTALRHACQVENDPDTVGLYIRFLVRFAPESLPELGDLCIDMSTIIVERSSINPAVIHDAATHRALLELFAGYTRRLIELGPASVDAAFSSVEQRAEAVTVLFNPASPSGGGPAKQATLHFFVVHAQIILLTFVPKAAPASEDARVAAQLHEQLLHCWFRQCETPKAFVFSTKEDAVLIPDWLKLKMIRSDSPILVDTALRELDVSQLVLFIQSFGIPVASMSKLLGKLDSIAMSDPDSVNEAVMDRTYMGQLVAVQHRRGAKNGHKFANALKLPLDMYSKERSEQVRQAAQEERLGAAGDRAELTLPPRSTALIPPGHVKQTLLHLFDVGSPSRMTMKEKRDAFRTLQKLLVAEAAAGGDAPAKPMLEATVKALEQVFRSEQKAQFINAMTRRLPFSCALLRVVLSAVQKLGGSSQTSVLAGKVFGHILDHLRAKGDESSPLVTLLTSNVKGFVVPPNESAVVATKNQRSSSPSPSKSGRKKSDRKRKKDDGGEKPALVSANLEKDIHLKVEEALRRRSTGSLVNEMAELLLAEEEEDESRKRASQQRCSAAGKAGLFVDWLEMLDPELIQLEDEVKQQLLFARMLLKVTGSAAKKRATAATPPSSGERRLSRPYLLTLLTHQSSWRSLRAAVNQVLKEFREDFEPSAVLDFLTACVYIPKLWHGVDKHQPKHAAPTDVLDLAEDQIRVLVDYQIAEVVAQLQLGQESDDLLRDRANLLHMSLSSREKANTAVEHLFWRIVGQGVEEERREASRRLLLLVYMGRPSCLVQLQTGGIDCQSLLPRQVPSSSEWAATTCMDVASHTILSALSATPTQHGRQWTSQMIEFEAAARKIAGCHPLLFLRNLPLVAASLKGRTDYDFSYFRSRHHLTLYSIAIGLLDLLRPHVFKAEHRQGLCETLKCYFSMIRSYLDRRDSLQGVINKFLIFLNDFLEEDPVPAIEFIREEGKVLLELNKRFNSTHVLAAIVNHVGDFGSSSAGSAVLTPPGASFSQQARRDAATDAARAAAALQQAATDEELAAALREANDACQGGGGARASVLETLSPEICSLVAHSNPAIRGQAHNLLLKCMRFSPRPAVTRELASAFVRCLESPDAAVAQTALEKLPDTVVLAQESLVEIMSAVFNLGIRSGFSISQYVADTVCVLNTSLGY